MPNRPDRTGPQATPNHTTEASTGEGPGLGATEGETYRGERVMSAEDEAVITQYSALITQDCILGMTSAAKRSMVSSRLSSVSCSSSGAL